ncbi:hypothetical protein A3709_18105 [Halioglobus sp. HI00S01]|uniref:hypothetical protein n=1 Tax=Halioglobus sp. HI00S01 TaxID=1822214 RepID=UPI0007C20B94|nr:hypothetical protein [Halioglobus sp. HI00S01]KZX58620.1 hypothetical protein A3709_18105 [Halioglobus sp. HI00S01]
MKLTCLHLQSVTTGLLLLASNSSFAGVANPVITLTPQAEPPAPAPVADAVAPAVPVPVMSDLLMVVLGITLVTIAVRVLRKSNIGDKLLGVAVLCTGVAIGGFGARHAEALIEEYLIEDPNCGSVTEIQYNPYDPTMPPIKNTCGETYEVTEKDEVVPGFCAAIVEGTCSAGTALETGQTCIPDYIEEDVCER